MLSTAAAGTALDADSCPPCRSDDRNITENDTFLFGSGTKPFVAARVFQHIEAGKLSLSSLVAEQVDPLLHAASSMMTIKQPFRE